MTVARSAEAGNGSGSDPRAPRAAAPAEREPSRTSEDLEAEHGPDAGDVAALALELLAHGATVDLERDGWRLVAHPRA